jgi:trans-aconitate methyltransferase
VWAVESLGVRPDDKILEIGCGRGVAAALICQRFGGGRLVALDRSAKAIAAASARNADHVTAGRAQFKTTSLEDLDPAGLGRFHKVLAVNVNLFWVRPARAELDLIADLLLPDGLLQLVYDPPDVDALGRLQGKVVHNLEQAGYRCGTTTHATERSRLLAVTARPSADMA